MAHGHASDLEVPDPSRRQVLANLHRHVAFHDLAVVQIHLHLDIVHPNALHDLMRLRLVVQKESGDITGVDRLNQHITAL